MHALSVEDFNHAAPHTAVFQIPCKFPCYQGICSAQNTK